MFKRVLKKLLAPVVREVLKEERKKSEAATDEILRVLEKTVTSL